MPFWLALPRCSACSGVCTPAIANGGPWSQRSRPRSRLPRRISLRPGRSSLRPSPLQSNSTPTPRGNRTLPPLNVLVLAGNASLSHRRKTPLHRRPRSRPTNCRPRPANCRQRSGPPRGPCHPASYRERLETNWEEGREIYRRASRVPRRTNDERHTRDTATPWLVTSSLTHVYAACIDHRVCSNDVLEIH